MAPTYPSKLDHKTSLYVPCAFTEASHPHTFVLAVAGMPSPSVPGIDRSPGPLSCSLFHLVLLRPVSGFPMGAMGALCADGGGHPPPEVMGRKGGSKEGSQMAVGHVRTARSPHLHPNSGRDTWRAGQMLRPFRVTAQVTLVSQTPHLSFCLKVLSNSLPFQDIECEETFPPHSG